MNLNTFFREWIRTFRQTLKGDNGTKKLGIPVLERLKKNIRPSMTTTDVIKKIRNFQTQVYLRSMTATLIFLFSFFFFFFFFFLVLLLLLLLLLLLQ